MSARRPGAGARSVAVPGLLAVWLLRDRIRTLDVSR